MSLKAPEPQFDSDELFYLLLCLFLLLLKEQLIKSSALSHLCTSTSERQRSHLSGFLCFPFDPARTHAGRALRGVGSEAVMSDAGVGGVKTGGSVLL